jgi:hypothetical protein
MQPPSDCVVIVAPRDDIHGLAIAARITELYDGAVLCRLFDPATYPLRSSLQAHLDGSLMEPILRVAPPLARTLGPRAASILVHKSHGQDQPVVHLQPSTAVWWRRYRRPILHPDVTEPEFQEFCSDALRSTLLGALSLCRVYNPIGVEEMSDYKLRQLYLAKDCGLNVPRTLVCTDGLAATHFVDLIEREGRRAIYKHATSVAAFGMPTRIVDTAARARFAALKYAPALFQEEISGGPELRIAVIGSEIFCCEWFEGRPDRRFVDIKVQDDLKLHQTTLPSCLQSPLRNLQDRLGLAIGVYDFKVDEAGRPFFLEVNPSGQWLDMEVEGREPVSESLARLLVEGVNHVRASRSEPYSMADLMDIAKPLDRPVPMVWTRVA